MTFTFPQYQTTSALLPSFRLVHNRQLHRFRPGNASLLHVAIISPFKFGPDSPLANFQSFTILRLPYLALEKAIKLMDIKEQFHLSILSKRCHRIVKCVFRNRKHEARLSIFSDRLYVTMSSTNGDDHLLFYLADVSTVHPIKNVLDHLKNTFVVLSMSLLFYGIKSPNVDIIPYLKTLGVRFSVVAESYIQEEQNDKLCELILMECTNAEVLNVDIETSPSFSLELDHFGPFQSNRFTNCYSSWITMDHIIRSLMNCKDVSLYNCSFSNLDLNRFMKTWMEGSRIEHLQLSNVVRSSVSLDEVLNGIPAIPARADKLKVYWFGPKNGFIVQQKSGLNVFVYQMFDSWFVMTTEYELEVDEGN